jgi:hypothetical protein
MRGSRDCAEFVTYLDLFACGVSGDCPHPLPGSKGMEYQCLPEGRNVPQKQVLGVHDPESSRAPSRVGLEARISSSLADQLSAPHSCRQSLSASPPPLLGRQLDYSCHHLGHKGNPMHPWKKLWRKKQELCGTQDTRNLANKTPPTQSPLQCFGVWYLSIMVKG